MMQYIDRFMDTKEKRYHLLLLIICCMLLVLLIPYVILAIYLLTQQSYDSLFSLLKTPIVHMTYLSRVILDVISLSSLQFITVLHIIFVNFYWYEIFTIVLLILIYPIIERKKIFTIGFVLLLLEVLICTFCVIQGSQAASLNGAVRYLKIIGGVVFVVNSIYVGFVLHHMRRQFRFYRKAMKYTVIEIKEHMSD